MLRGISSGWFVRLAAILMILTLGACGDKPPQYNGYIDADLIYLSSNAPGRVSQLWVKRGEQVQVNQRLFQVEKNPEQSQEKDNEAKQGNLQAQRQAVIDQIRYAQITLKRAVRMKKSEAASQNDIDVAQKDLSVLKDQLQSLDYQLKSNQASIEGQRFQVARKKGAAPEAGLIFDTYYNRGEFVQAGQPILALLTPSHIKATFFVPETALSQLKLNAKVKMSSDGKVQLATGHINYISPIAEYTSPQIYSREERHGLVFRVEASIDSPDLNQLHLGQPMTLEVLA